jgi:methyl-accepting chemotaxis protein
VDEKKVDEKVDEKKVDEKVDEKKVDEKKVEENVDDKEENFDKLTNRFLASANKLLNTPEGQVKLAQAVEKMEVISDKLLARFDPITKKVTDKLAGTFTKAGTKFGQSGVRIVSNTAEAVPGLGAAIAVANIANSAAQAVESVVEATNELSSTVKDTIRSIKGIMGESSDITNRVDQSVNNFNKTDFIPHPPSVPKPVPVKGGTRKKRRNTKLSRRR